MYGRGWTNHEIRTAAEMKRLGHTYREIGERFNRKPGSVKAVLIRNGLTLTVKEAAIKREITKKLLGHTHIQQSQNNVVRGPNVPEYLIAERDQRANEYRTPAQIHLGDPPPSQSALARLPPRAGAGLVQSRESLRD